MSKFHLSVVRKLNASLFYSFFKFNLIFFFLQKLLICFTSTANHAFALGHVWLHLVENQHVYEFAPVPTSNAWTCTQVVLSDEVLWNICAAQKKENTDPLLSVSRSVCFHLSSLWVADQMKSRHFSSLLILAHSCSDQNASSMRETPLDTEIQGRRCPQVAEPIQTCWQLSEKMV